MNPLHLALPRAASSICDLADSLSPGPDAHCVVIVEKNGVIITALYGGNASEDIARTRGLLMLERARDQITGGAPDATVDVKKP